MITKHKINYRLIFGGFFLSLIVTIFIVLSTPEMSHAIEIQPVYKVLAGTTGASKQIKDVWSQILTFINSIAIVMLIFIAFANILRININTYGVKKFLPSLALAIIAANFSYLFCRILVDFANVACGLFINGPGVGSAVSGAFDFTGPAYAVTPDNLLFSIVLTLLEFVGSVAMLILAFMFFIRMYVIYFLVALSPITIVCIVLPLTKSVFNMWWQNFWKWTFMPVVSLFWLWIGGLWVTSTAGTTSVAPSGGAAGGSIILGFAFAIFCYYLAITTPSKMGQGVMTTWNNLGKWGWGKAGKQVGGAGARMSYFGQNLQKQNVKGSFWHKVGSGLEKTGGVVNVPATYDALKRRHASAMANLQKASLKTGTYQRFGGRDVTIEGQRARHEDTIKNMPAEITGHDMGGIEDNILGALRNPRSRQERKMMEEVNSLLAPYGGYNGATEAQRRASIRRVLSSEGVSNLLLKYQGIGGELKNESESVMAEGLARNFTREAKGQRSRGLLVVGYGARPLPISAVGEETGENAPDIPVQRAREDLTAALGDPSDPRIAETAQRVAGIALHGNGNITVNAHNLHLNMTPQARTQAEEAFNALRGKRNAIRGEEMGGHQRRIDREMAGAKIVHSQIQRGVAREGLTENATISAVNQNAKLGLMGLSASEGLSLLQKNDVTSAISVAKKIGQTDIGGTDDPDTKKRLNSFFRSIQSGVRDIQGQRDGAGRIPNWLTIETNLIAAKSTQATQLADTATSARIITEQHTPAIIQILGNATVADALGEQSTHLAELTQHLNTIVGDTAKVRDLQPIALSPQQSQQTLLEAISGAGVSKDTPMSDAMSNPEVRTRFARQIGKEIVEANRRAPQVDAVKPRTQQPFNAPGITNVTNVTNVGQNNLNRPHLETGHQPSPPVTPHSTTEPSARQPFTSTNQPPPRPQPPAPRPDTIEKIPNAADLTHANNPPVAGHQIPPTPPPPKVVTPPNVTAPHTVRPIPTHLTPPNSPPSFNPTVPKPNPTPPAKPKPPEKK